ncbi:MAG: PadR family transcriptional regulator [Candidatus Sericytochromatia bacterium]
MSLDFAILGFLNEQPLSGYDLKTKHFDLCVSHFWNADQGQIYKTLDKLVDKKLVTFELQYQDNKPNKKIYSITDKGKGELLEWLEKEIENAPIREGFAVKIFFAHNISNEKIIELFEKKKIKHQTKLKEYLEIEKNFFNNEDKKNRKKVLEFLTLDLGIKYEKNWLSWCEESIEKLKSL